MRTIEEDVQSEIGVSEVGHTTKSAEAHYRVSLAGTVFDRSKVESNTYECTFITRGMDDQQRMRRAIYFFEIALFNQGFIRHKLLTTSYDSPDRVSHMMYAAMVAAYKTFSEFLSKKNEEHTIYVIGLDRLTQLPIAHTHSPLVRRLYTPVEPIAFHMVWCRKCMRVSDGTPDHASDPQIQYLCPKCSH